MSQPAKTPKTNTKLKLTTPKTPASEPAKKKKPAKPKSTGKKKAVEAASDDEIADTPKAEEKPLTAAENKEKKEKMGESAPTWMTFHVLILPSAVLPS